METKDIDIEFIVESSDVEIPKTHDYKQTELLSTYCDRRK